LVPVLLEVFLASVNIYVSLAVVLAAVVLVPGGVLAAAEVLVDTELIMVEQLFHYQHLQNIQLQSAQVLPREQGELQIHLTVVIQRSQVPE
jgi:hypothetical protein